MTCLEVPTSGFFLNFLASSDIISSFKEMQSFSFTVFHGPIIIEWISTFYAKLTS